MTAEMASKHRKNTRTKVDNLLIKTKPLRSFIVIYLKNFRGSCFGSLPESGAYTRILAASGLRPVWAGCLEEMQEGLTHHPLWDKQGRAVADPALFIAV
jgi:hypothetical protein